MTLSLIVAMSGNRVIGRNGALPWHLPADLRRFKQLTMGHSIIMGRKTFESIGRVLPGRTTIVVTRQADFHPEGVRVAGSLGAAIRLSTTGDEVFIVGGGRIYAEALPMADRIYLTAVQADVDGDTFFPSWDESCWRQVADSWHAADDKHAYACRFLVFDRTDQAPEFTLGYQNLSKGTTAMTQSVESQLLDLTRQLLEAIGTKNWERYAELCDSSLTCFEPEARGHLVEGLDFHKYYFGLPGAGGNRNTTLSAPHVRRMGDSAAVVSYVRLVQYVDPSGQALTASFEETRVWEKQQGEWKHVHFHRSANV